MRNILIFIIISCAVSLQSQDRLFTYTYQSNVLNKSQKEIEVVTTFRNGRNNYYRTLKHRLEFELGLGSKIQTSFYLNYSYSNRVVENYGVQSLESNVDYNFSNEWKFKLSDPVANAIGSALYFEYTLSPSIMGYEAKIIFDKQLGNIIQAFNIVGEYEMENMYKSNGNKIDISLLEEKVFELNYALSFNLKEGLSLGIELLNQNGLSKSFNLEYSTFSGGPCLSFNQGAYWINYTILPQITNLKGFKRELNNHEKFQTRLIFSYEL